MVHRAIWGIFFAALAWVAPAQATVPVSDFSNFSAQLFPPMGLSWSNLGTDQYLQNPGFITIAPVGGGNPAGDGYFFAGFSGGGAIDFTGLSVLTLTARIDLGNASSVARVIFYDSTATAVASGTFQASSFNSSFSSQSVPLTSTGFGDVGVVTYWRVEGDGIASDAFRYSLDNLNVSAIPEPSTWSLALGLIPAIWNRRRKR